MTDACSPRCQRAGTKPGTCRCSCNGRLHGVERDETTYLDGLAEARRRGLHRLTDLEVLTA